MTSEFLIPTREEIAQLTPVCDQHELQLYLASKYPYDRSQMGEALAPQLAGFIYEWLHHLGCLTEAQIQRATDAFISDLATWKTDPLTYLTAPQFAQPGVAMILAEYRYLLWSGRLKYIDLVDNATVSIGNDEFITVLSCNVTRLLKKKQQWLRQLRGIPAAAST